MQHKYLIPISFWIFTFSASVSFASSYQDGDLIFHESRSNQSKAIQEATESRWSHVGIIFIEKGRWFVAEAVQPVRATPLSSFIARGLNQDYRIYRLPGLTHQNRKDLRVSAKKFFDKNYDIYFEWSDDLIYCSEFVYKVFYAATGIEVGTIQKFRDLKLNGPFVQDLIRRRLSDTGRALNLDESILTPIAQMNDTKLDLIEKSEH